ncbi:MAG: hypothetical protein AMS27_14895, partial [Bacteroides sp. SM23_62_1]
MSWLSSRDIYPIAGGLYLNREYFFEYIIILNLNLILGKKWIINQEKILIISNSSYHKIGILFFLFLGFVISLASAQLRTVTGTITSEEGDPLAGVIIMVRGTTQETLTGADGKYSIGITGTDA